MELEWRKSTYSAVQSECIEVAWDGSTVYVRDSKDPDGGMLKISPGGWQEFLAKYAQR